MQRKIEEEISEIFLSVDFIRHWEMLDVPVTDEHRKELVVQAPPLWNPSALILRQIRVPLADAMMVGFQSSIGSC